MLNQRVGVVSYRVLLVEDLDQDALLVQRRLMRAQLARFDLTHVIDLKAALAAIESAEFDLILTDLSLPDSDGINTVKRLRTAAPELPIVVLTASQDDSLRLDVLASGADDFVSKDGVQHISLSSGLAFAAQRGRVVGQLRSLVARHADAAVVVDEIGTILYVNAAAEALFGRPAVELLGTPLGLPLDSEMGARVEIRRPGGVIRDGELRTSRLVWDERNAVLASIRDVSDRHRAEALERRLLEADRLASIGQLASGVAHLINNPAAFVLANSTLMLEEIEEIHQGLRQIARRIESHDGARDDVDRMLRDANFEERLQGMREMAEDSVAGIQRISGIVRDLGGFARAEAGDVAEVDLAELAEVACDLLRSSVQGRAQLVQRLERTRPVALDRQKIVQAIVNVLLNAIWAVDGVEGDKRIVIATRELTDGVCVSVEDTGCGVSPQHEKRIFEPFFTTRESDGARGLGLSLCIETIRKHGGRVSFETKVGAGSRFDLFVPFDTGLTLGTPV